LAHPPSERNIMIHIDASEVRKGTRMPKIKNLPVKISNRLEELTGADFIISPLEIPTATRKLIQKHIDAGALLVQRKTGSDLASSVGTRMNDSLMRMREYNIRNCQCVLLFVGTLDINADGYAIINGYKERIKYWSLQSAFDKWTDRGGVVKFILADNMVGEWLIRKEKHVVEFKEFPVKRVWQIREMPAEVDETDPIQEMVPVSNKVGHFGYWRPMMVQIPGLGPTRVNALYRAMKEYYGGKGIKDWDNPLFAISFITGPLAVGVDGIGKGIHKKVRTWFGLEDVYEISVTANDEDVTDRRMKEMLNGE